MALPTVRPAGIPMVVARRGDAFLAHVQRTVAHAVAVDGRAGVEDLLEQLAGEARPASAGAMLDLVGHSTPGDQLLELGDWVVDARDPDVLAWFRKLAGDGVPVRLGIAGVRLLGCGTAETPAGRHTIETLAGVLGIDVYGTRGPVMAAQFNADGFDPAWRFVLASAREPANPVVTVAAPAPIRRHVTDPNAVARLLRLVDREAGAPLAHTAVATCELVLGGSDASTARVVRDGSFLELAGVAYPVKDPVALRHLVEQFSRRHDGT